MLGFGKNYGSYTTGGQTATAGTVIVVPLPPYMGEGVAPPIFKYNATAKKADWMSGTGAALSRLATLQYTNPADAHALTILRPLNFTYFTAAVAAGTTNLPVAGDPGVYSTNYLYPLTGGNGFANGPGGPSQVSDHAAASGDYVMYQLLDGTWYVDTVAAGVYSAGILAVTNGPPSPTVAANGGCNANGPVFYFGSTSTLDPATGYKPSTISTTATAATTIWIANTYAGSVTTLHYGDPLIVLSNNVTAAGTFNDVTIVYGRH